MAGAAGRQASDRSTSDEEFRRGRPGADPMSRGYVEGRPIKGFSSDHPNGRAGPRRRAFIFVTRYLAIVGAEIPSGQKEIALARTLCGRNKTGSLQMK